MKSFYLQASPYEKLTALSQKEKNRLLLRTVLVIGLLDYCFYKSLPAILLLLPFSLWYYDCGKRELKREKRTNLLQQFKELLLITAASLRTGYSLENALLSSEGDLAELFGEESGICLMLQHVRESVRNQQPFYDLFLRIGEDVQIEEIREFAQVLRIARESGGHMGEIMERTARVIESKADTRSEIEVMLSARKLEQKIMNGMPLFIILYISLSSPDYFAGYYHSAGGVLVMSGCLVVYFLAYLMGKRLSTVEV